MTASALQATSYKAELSTAKPKTWTPGHLSLPTSALNDLYLILTSLFTLPHWLCSSTRASWQFQDTLGKLPLKVTAHAQASSHLKVTANAAFSEGCYLHPQHQLQGLLVQLLKVFI